MKKKIIIAICIFIALGVCALIFYKCQNNNEDSIKFKEEYESLNNTVSESSKTEYKSITIDENNPIVYASVRDVLDLMDNKEDALIYVGASWCPWCRSAVPVLLQAASDLNIDKIYYLNLDNDKSLFEVKDGELVKSTDGTSDYYELLLKLDDYLREYYISDSDGNTYDTLEKRIYMPYLIGIKNGEVANQSMLTYTLNDGQTTYDEITTSQYDNIYSNVESVYNSVYSSNTCSISGSCQ